MVMRTMAMTIATFTSIATALKISYRLEGKQNQIAGEFFWGSYTPEINLAMENPPVVDIFNLLEMVNFQPAMLVYWSVF